MNGEPYQSNLRRPSQRPGEFNRQPQRERVPDEILGEEVITTERKTIVITRRQNRGGQFLRILEERNGQRNLVCIPADNVEDVLAAIDKLFPEEPAA